LGIEIGYWPPHYNKINKLLDDFVEWHLEKCHYNNNARALTTRLVRIFKKQYKNALA